MPVPKAIHHPAYRALIACLRARRVQLGWRQQDLARRLELPRSWVTKVETAERRLDILELCRLCRVLDVRVSTVLDALVIALDRP